MSATHDLVAPQIQSQAPKAEAAEPKTPGFPILVGICAGAISLLVIMAVRLASFW